MFYLADLKQSKENKTKDTLKTVGGLYLGQQTIRSGLPRALGVRLESHSTSKKRAREILKNGGFLEPSRGGTGASKMADNWVENSKGRVYITGKNSKGVPSQVGLPKFLDNPFFDRFQASVQRKAYRANAGTENLNLGNFLGGATGTRGRTLYLGGSDKYFNSNFQPAPDDYALITNQKVKVFGNRASATVDAIKREGLVNLIKDNPKRVLSGLGILGVGGYSTYKLLKRKTRSDKGKNRGKYKR